MVTTKVYNSCNVVYLTNQSQTDFLVKQIK